MTQWTVRAYNSRTEGPYSKTEKADLWCRFGANAMDTMDAMDTIDCFLLNWLTGWTQWTQ
ncbi:hypothetical protein HOD20_07300 [archaeon]|nr:hypothetical protein [archaeon]